MRSATLSTIIMVMLLAMQDVMACPACKDSYTKNSHNATVGEAYSLSVIVMLAVPMTILTVGIIAVARRLRQHPNTIA